jgi:AraC family transcriptional regulator
VTALLTPEELPTWVPGEITAASDDLGWKNIAMRGYRYRGQDVFIPPMRDFLIVSYKRGDTPMERRFEGAWTQTKCAPGSVSLLTRAQRSNWNWSQHIDVCHLYLADELLTRLASEVMDRIVTEVRLRDILNVEDPLITSATDAIRQEAERRALGGSLFVEAVGTQLAVHLLRHYSSVSFREPRDPGHLSATQKRRVTDYVESHLADSLDLAALAAAAGLGVWSFNRRFRASFGCAPYAYVIERRLARARAMIEGAALPLKAIAQTCGFNDQAHMTRTFKSRLNVTPGALQRQAQR